MAFRLRFLFRHAARFVWYGSIGVLLALVIVFVLLMNNRPDLSVWHLAELDEEFTVDSEVSSFGEYLALEDRLFKQLDDEVFNKVGEDQKGQINRYSKGSLSDPDQWPRNWIPGNQQ